MAVDPTRDGPRDASPDPNRGRNVKYAIVILVLLVAAMWAMQQFGRNGTRTTPGGVKVPEATGRAGAPNGTAPANP